MQYHKSDYFFKISNFFLKKTITNGLKISKLFSVKITFILTPKKQAHSLYWNYDFPTR